MYLMKYLWVNYWFLMQIIINMYVRRCICGWSVICRRIIAVVKANDNNVCHIDIYSRAICRYVNTLWPSFYKAPVPICNMVSYLQPALIWFNELWKWYRLRCFLAEQENEEIMYWNYCDNINYADQA